ncbi:FkbM family methyltransferase [Actinobacteria bacterium IMCC26103]|nr:FkbM family methyltransferase [Actinobacteria bacterium IMCC26103]
MKTENFRKLLRLTSPTIAKLNPRLRLRIAKTIPSEGIRTLFDPNSIRNYAKIGRNQTFKTIKLDSGISASVDINDIIGYRTALNKKWDDSSLNFIKQYEANETLYIDIGANTGLTSIPIAALGYETIAFEPNPYALAQLTHNLSLNSPIKFCLFPFALGNSRKNIEYVQLYSPPGNLGATSVNRDWSPGLIENNSVLAPIISLDQAIASVFTPEKITSFRTILIKMDAEGFEDEVIEGASGLVNSFRPVILFENNPPTSQNSKKKRFWESLENYDFIVIEDGAKVDFDPNRRYENVFAVPHEKLQAIKL